MATISRLTQSRLSVLLFDKVTNAFLKRVPVYAEMSVTADIAPAMLRYRPDFTENETAARNWLSKHPGVLDLIDRAMSANLGMRDFNAIPNKHQLYLSILETLKANLSDGATDAEKTLLINKTVTQALRRAGITPIPQANTQTLFSFPLGTLATDHVGYISWDLTNVSTRFDAMVRKAALDTSDISFFVYPFGKEELKIDVLKQGRVTTDVVFAKVPLEFPREFDEVKRSSLPSMQNPELEDWYLSPGSFALNPGFFIGADGCEQLYPANFATHEFRFFQIIRGSKVLIENSTKTVDRVTEGADGKTTTEKSVEITLEVRAGWSLEYMVSWQPLGHTIGQIVYSLPLAPGETVKIAVIDWARKSIDSRNEDLTVKEQLAHNTRRDRNVSETVDAALHEWQRGGSFMAGVAGSYGGAGYGISGALGGGYSTSSGDRNVHASTVQQISDAFAQASSSIRELRSTIVVQSDQQEHAKAETRVVANHNHSHALTILYYEVLRHYKVTTQFMRLRPSLLVRYAHIDFGSLYNIIRYRQILESVLIEGRYLACFDAVQKLQCLTGEFARKKAQLLLAPNLNDINELGDIKLVIKTKRANQGYARIFVITKNTEQVECLLVSPPWDPEAAKTVGFPNASLPISVDDGTPGVTRNYRQDGQSNVFVVKPYKSVIWSDVGSLLLKLEMGDPQAWEIESIQAMSTHGDKTWLMVDSNELSTIPQGSPKLWPIQPYKDIPKDPTDVLTEDERCCINKLKVHLAENAFHYQKAIWLQEDANERADRFKGMSAGGTAVIDLIDNRPMDVLGDYVVFPSRKFHEASEELNALDRVSVEKLMSLPTRGVFAEARLGHCNASEEIDDTRFWDWQRSPITEEAPAIESVNINNSRNTAANLTPTQLPSSIINIVSPQALPDPGGMAGALGLLGRSDVFRDMSVSKEVEDLLEKLADKSVGIGEAADKAKEIQQQREASKSSAGVASPPATAPQPKLAPAEAQQQIKVSENQAGKGTITPEEHKENVKKWIDSMPGGPKGTAVTVTINFKHSISGPLDGEFRVEFLGPIIDGFDTRTVGGVGAGKVTIQTGAEYTIQIAGRRTRLPKSLDSVALIPAVAGNPPFDLDVSNHITKRDVPIEANIVATITKGRKAINITVVAEEVSKDIKITVKVTGSGTLKADLESEVGLKLVGVDVGHVKAGVAVETTVGADVTVELPIEYKRLTGSVAAPKNDLVL